MNRNIRRILDTVIGANATHDVRKDGVGDRNHVMSRSDLNEAESYLRSRGEELLVYVVDPSALADLRTDEKFITEDDIIMHCDDPEFGMYWFEEEMGDPLGVIDSTPVYVDEFPGETEETMGYAFGENIAIHISA